MNRLMPLGNHLRLLCRSLPQTTSQTVSVKTWNYGWKPGPVPVTKEEHEIAAKKYGLDPTEYKPYKNEIYAYGDYPDLEPVYHAFRDPYEYFQDYKNRRHFGEPINEMYEVYQVSSRLGEPHQESLAKYCLHFVNFVIGYTLFSLLLNKCVQFPGYQKFLPYSDARGGLHYSFEFEDEDDED